MTAENSQVSTTTGKKEDAERIAGALVNLRLAACVQVLGPVDLPPVSTQERRLP